MQTKTHQAHRLYRFLGVVAALMLVIVGVIVLELTNTDHFFHKQRAATVFETVPIFGGASTESNKGQGSQLALGSSNTPSNGSDKGDQAMLPVAFITPFGDFVSNHTPGQHGSPLTETSVCNTTSGATCAITFTMGNIARSLTQQTTDLNGQAYWNNWTPAGIGLGSGSWQVTAVATLNGQTKTATDPTDLSVP